VTKIDDRIDTVSHLVEFTAATSNKMGIFSAAQGRILYLTIRTQIWVCSDCCLLCYLWL